MSEPMMTDAREVIDEALYENSPEYLSPHERLILSAAILAALKAAGLAVVNRAELETVRDCIANMDAEPFGWGQLPFTSSDDVDAKFPIRDELVSGLSAMLAAEDPNP